MRLPLAMYRLSLAGLLVAGLSAGCDGGGGGGGGGGDAEGLPGEDFVLATTPADGAEGVAADSAVTITFDRPALPDTLDGGIDPEPDDEPLIIWSDGNTTLTLALPSGYEPGVTYTVEITDLLFADGSRLTEPFLLTFATSDDESGEGEGEGEGEGDCVPMECPFDVSEDTMAVVCTTPTPCSTDVSTTAALLIEFNRPFDLNDLGADILSETGEGFDVEVSQSDDGRTLIVTPRAPFPDDVTHSIVIAFVSDTEGNRFSDLGEFCFSTGSELNCPSPAVCQEVDATDAGVSAAADFDYERPFADDSVWNTPIGNDPEGDPDSDEMIARFGEVFAASGGIAVSYRQDAVPVYIAEAQTPRVDVALTASATGALVMENVPLPAQALPDCGFDTLMGALDSETDVFYEFWRAVKNDDGSWQATTAGSIDITGSGIYPGDGSGSEGIRASGFSLLAGMIWPHELEAGAIDHAIVFYYTATRAGPPVLPATASDGPIDDPAALPMGSLLQLDPDLDLDTLNLDPWERTIAAALQTYGMYCGDTGGGIGISMLHGYTFEGNPYDGLLPPEADTDGVAFLTKLPPESFRVLKPPSE